MSEDAHESYNPDIDPTVCCIFGCGDPSTMFLDSHWYCDLHGKEYERDRSCAEPGCTETGVISSSKTTAKFCVNHAWKQDRTVDEHGLNHPEPKTEENLGKEIIKYVSPVKKSRRCIDSLASPCRFSGLHRKWVGCDNYDAGEV